jgi:hypothetical protein
VVIDDRHYRCSIEWNDGVITFPDREVITGRQAKRLYRHLSLDRNSYMIILTEVDPPHLSHEWVIDHGAD